MARPVRLHIIVWLGAALALHAPAQSDASGLAAALVKAASEAEMEKLLATAAVDAPLVDAVAAEATSFDRRGDFAGVLKASQLQTRLAVQLGDRERERKGLHSTAYALSRLGDLEAGLETLQKALALARQQNDAAHIAIELIELGIVQKNLGDYGSAVESEEQALAIIRQSANREQEARVYNTLGSVYLSLGRYSQSLRSFERGLQLAEAANLRQGIAFLVNNIATVYNRQGNDEAALRYLRRSLDIKKELGNQGDLGTTYQNLGEACRRLGRSAEALQWLNLSLGAAEASGAKVGTARALMSIAALERESRKFDASIAHLTRAVELTASTGARPTQAVALSDLALSLIAARRYDEALLRARECIELSNALAAPDAGAAAYEAAGRASEGARRRAEAREYYLQSVRLIEEIRDHIAGADEGSGLFMASQISPYHALVRMAVEDGKPEEAFRWAEQSRARALADIVANGGALTTKAMTAEERAEERRLAKQVEALTSKLERERRAAAPDAARIERAQRALASAHADSESLRDVLFVRHPELKANRARMQPVSVATAAECLPGSRSALLEYVVSEDAAYVFTVSREPRQARAWRIPIARRALEEKVRRYRDLLASRDPGVRDAGRELYRLLVEPARAVITGKDLLVVAPDGPLWTLPFQALQPADGRYLIEQHAVAYTPSATVLAEILQRERAGEVRPSSVLAVGFGVPGAAEEARLVGGLYDPARSRVIESATETAFKSEAGKYGTIHIAAHAELDDHSPMYSHVLLGAGSDDGRLEAAELMNMNLKSRLVVLSACETAGGKILNGEGVVGLTWALFVAGVPTTVATNWKIDSAATVGFMTGFHGGLRAGATPASALRQSALKLLSTPERRHPFYWASFSVFGAGF